MWNSGKREQTPSPKRRTPVPDTPAPVASAFPSVPEFQSKDPRSRLRGIETGYPVAGVARPRTGLTEAGHNQAEASFGGIGPKEIKRGGQTRNRTEDTRIFSPLLYQLSYLAERVKGQSKRCARTASTGISNRAPASPA